MTFLFRKEKQISGPFDPNIGKQETPLLKNKKFWGKIGKVVGGAVLLGVMTFGAPYFFSKMHENERSGGALSKRPVFSCKYDGLKETIVTRHLLDLDTAINVVNKSPQNCKVELCDARNASDAKSNIIIKTCEPTNELELGMIKDGTYDVKKREVQAYKESIKTMILLAMLSMLGTVLHAEIIRKMKVAQQTTKQQPQ